MEDRRLATTVVGTVSVAHFVSHVFLLAYPPLFPLLASEFDVSTARLGLLVTAIYVPQLLLQLPLGEAVDRIGAKWVLVAGLFVTSVSIGGSGLATTYWMLLGFALMSGIGQSVFHPADYALLESVTTPDTEGTAFSAHTFGGFAGFAAAPLAIGTVGIAAGWDVALLAAGAVGAVLAVAIGITMEPVHTRRIRSDSEPDTSSEDDVTSTVDDADPTSDGARSEANSETAGTLRQFVAFLRRTDLLLVFLFYLVSMMALVGLQSFTTVLAVEEYGLTESNANTLLTVHLTSTAVGVIAGGPLANRASFRWVVVGLFGLSAVSVWTLVLVPVTTGFAVALVVLGLVGVLVGLALPSRDRFANAVVDPDAVGKSFGFFFTGLSLGAVISPALLGGIIDRWSAAVAFLVVGLFLAVAASIVVVAAHREP